jgi:hypothetical protein
MPETIEMTFDALRKAFTASFEATAEETN